MKIKTALAVALLVGCGLVSACAETQKNDDTFTQSTTEYDTVIQGDHGTRSWKKISREPSAIAAPTPAVSAP